MCDARMYDRRTDLNELYSHVRLRLRWVDRSTPRRSDAAAPTHFRPARITTSFPNRVAGHHCQCQCHIPANASADSGSDSQRGPQISLAREIAPALAAARRTFAPGGTLRRTGRVTVAHGPRWTTGGMLQRAANRTDASQRNRSLPYMLRCERTPVSRDAVIAQSLPLPASSRPRTQGPSRGRAVSSGSTAVMRAGHRPSRFVWSRKHR